MKMSAKVPPPLTWHICCIIVDFLDLVISIYILNQPRGHWLLNDALNFSISMSLKFKDEIDFATFENLMEGNENVVYEIMFGLQHKKEVVQDLDFFLSFLKKYENRKAHNMFSLMLDPRFKTFDLVSTFISCEQGNAIVEKYDKNLCFLCLLNVIIIWIHWLNLKRVLLIKGWVEKDRSLDIFEMTASTSELAMKLVNRELLIFKHYQVDVKDIKCPL